MKAGVYFVTGIDTDAGKSYVTGYIAKELLQRGESVITQKFIQTGGVEPNGISLDINIHRAIMGCGLLAEDLDGTTAPEIFSYPASPHLAAVIDDRAIDFEAIKRSTELLSSKYNTLLIEGAGGLHVPLKGSYTTADYIKDNNLKVIVATSGKLGSINHTLLTLEVCKSRGIEVAVVAYNQYFAADKVINSDTFEYISSYVKKHFPECDIIEIESIDIDNIDIESVDVESVD